MGLMWWQRYHLPPAAFGKEGALVDHPVDLFVKQHEET